VQKRLEPLAPEEAVAGRVLRLVEPNPELHRRLVAIGGPGK
jgi:hypothetical protein